MTSLKIGKNCLVVSKTEDAALYKSVRNLENADFAALCGLNCYSVLKPSSIVITKDALQAIPEELK